MRYTERRNGKNVIPLRNAVCGVGLPKWSIDKHSDIQSFLSGDAVDRLAELEDKMEQGKLIELPCKVGDTVYMLTQVVVDFVSFKREWKIHNFQIDNIGIDEDGDFFTQDEHKIFYFDRAIFSTREEAEKRLKELQNA